jgi:hypothetical protein
VDPEEKPWVSAVDNCTPDIAILGATTYDNLLASDGTIETFSLQIGECSISKM